MRIDLKHLGTVEHLRVLTRLRRAIVPKCVVPVLGCLSCVNAVLQTHLHGKACKANTAHGSHVWIHAGNAIHEYVRRAQIKTDRGHERRDSGCSIDFTLTRCDEAHFCVVITRDMGVQGAQTTDGNVPRKWHLAEPCLTLWLKHCNHKHLGRHNT